MSLLVAKLGSSSLVDRDGLLRESVIEDRVAELCRLRHAGHHVLLVSSGAIAYGISRLGMHGRPTALPDLQAASAVGQGALFQQYERAFALHDVLPAQVLLTSGDLQGRRSYVNARNTLQRLLALGTVPILNENDTTATDELVFGDNDVLAAQVAVLLRARWLVLLTDREGLYGPGPDGPRLLGTVSIDVRPEEVELADMGGSGLGSGGVESKIAAAGMASAAGVDCVVASARADDVLGRVVAGEPAGTAFPARAGTESSFKLWLRHAKPSMGRVLVDAGAARALERRGTSLLPVGVVACEGSFGVGDAVEVAEAVERRPVGKGIAALSAEEVRAVAGLQSEEARRRLPGAAEEVIHRDRFVLAAEAGP